MKGLRALSRVFGPHRKAKNQKLLFTTLFVLFYYINNPSVYISMDLFSTVAMVTKMATNIGQNRENVISDHYLVVLLTLFLKIRYKHS